MPQPVPLSHEPGAARRTVARLSALALGGLLVTGAALSASPSLKLPASGVRVSDHSLVAADRGAGPETLLPAGVSTNWWTSVQRGLAEAEYRPSESMQGLQAPNRAHNIRTYFRPFGIRVRDRTAAGNPALVGLSLVWVGHGEALEQVGNGKVRRSGGRVEIQRPGVTEWYENSAHGLEQGFTLDKRPPGEGPLILELAVDGARATLRGDSVILTTDAGRRLRYGGLIAKDAAAATLASRLVIPSTHRIRLVVDDARASYPLVIDPLLTGTADAMLESNEPDSGSFDAAVFGGSVAAAGDVNGDGFPDVIVGARGWDNGLFDEGAAFVFLGSATGILGSDPLTAHAVILSNEAASEFGTSVAGAGDVNGDGFADIIVGAPFYPGLFRDDPTLSVKGAAFVFYGGSSGIVATDPTSADARIDANQVDAILGFSVAGAGDVNGDGFDDIIVGVPRQGSPTFPPNIPPNQGQGFGGAAVVFHGSGAGITGTGFDDADAVLLPYPAGFPEPSQTFMGSDVSGAGDVNSDGFDDILVYVNGAALFLGSAAGIVGTDPTTAHAHITGPGGVVSGAGDVNGDGFGDIILGAPGFPVPEPGFGPTNEGAFAVFLGSSVGITATDFSEAQAIVQGNIGQQQLGRSVAGAGDIDNDGFDDIIVGALGYAGSLDREGAAYVFRGEAVFGIAANTLLDAYVRLESNQSEAVRRLNRYEIDVAGIGDVNGDGFADVILGLGFFDAGELNEGAAFVYQGGGPAPINPNQPPVSDAGPDLVFVDLDNSGSATITADGSASFDPDGLIVNYAWFEGETLLGTSPVLTTGLTTTGDHTLVLTVTDDAGITRGDPVTVRVEPVETVQVLFDDFSLGLGAWVVGGDVVLSNVDTFPTLPQARVGSPSAFLSRSISLPVGSTGLTVSFWGKASQFSAADELLVKVSVDGGQSTTLQTITSDESDDTYVFYGGSAIPLGYSWFPATASNIVLEFESNMTTGLFFVDEVKVSALLAPPGTPLPPPGELPVADAGADATVDDNDSDGFEFVTLDGTLSTDTDGFIVAYEWYEVTSGGTALLGTGGATLAASFPRGSHIVQLIVTDNDGGSTSDNVLVTVNQAVANNQPPVANAGPDKTIADFDGDTLEFVRFDGRASTDPDGTIVSYDWTKSGNPFNNEAVFVLTLPIGVHTVELTVTDNQGATSTDTVVMTVAPNEPTITVDSLSASPSATTAGGSVTLNWTTTGADSVAIDHGVGVVAVDGSVTVNPTVTSTYSLTATGSGGTATSSVVVTVNSATTEDLTITQFEYRADKNEWRIGGTSTIPGPGNAMTLYVGPTVASSPVLGTATVNNLGNWEFRERNSSVNPDTSGTISIESSQGGMWEAISAVGPAPNSNPSPSPSPPLILPSIDSFSAAPSAITMGTSSTLTWTTSNATSVSIDNSVGTQLAPNGSATATPGTTTTYLLTATGAGGTATSSVTVTINSSTSPQGSVALSGPTSISRGARTSFILTLTNTGSSTITGAQLNFRVSPNALLKDVSPGSSVAVGSLAPGSSVSQTWNVRGDREGSGTVTAGASSGGTTLDTVTHSLTVVR